MSSDITPKIAERVKAEVLTMQTIDDLWVLATDFAELLDRAEKAEAERDAAFAAGQDAERERCWTLAMDAYEVWWRRSVAAAYDPLQKLADKIALPIKTRP